MGLNFAESFDKMYSTDYLDSLNLLQACHPQTVAQLKVLKEATDLLNNGAATSAINNCLYKASGFRTLLTPPASKQEFKVPALPK